MKVSVLRDPSGNKIRPRLFFVLINDLEVDNSLDVWNYVDDTTASEVVAKGNRSCAQEMAHKFAEWSTQNRVKLNLEISDVIKKASKRLYFLVRLKRSRVPWQDMSALYTACIRSRRGKLLEFGQNAWLFEILTDVITGRPLIFTVPDL